MVLLPTLKLLLSSESFPQNSKLKRVVLYISQRGGGREVNLMMRPSQNVNVDAEVEDFPWEARQRISRKLAGKPRILGFVDPMHT